MEEKKTCGSVRTIDFIADKAANGKSCGDFLKSKGVSRRLIVKLKRAEAGITRGGETIRTVDRIREGDVIALRLTDVRSAEPNSALYAPIVYEDSNTVVFNKPAGMPVHPSAGHRNDTLGNLFAAAYPSLTFRPVNRLDKNTSGLCAVAKNAHAANSLGGRLSKIYFAVTEGTPLPYDTGNPLIDWYGSGDILTIDAPVGRADGTVIKREIRADGKRAVTNYRILKEKDGLCLLKISLETGRTHQIRVHFSSVGHPLAGDDLYGGGTKLCGAQALHCGEMSFLRVSDGVEIKLSCPIREEMIRLFD